MGKGKKRGRSPEFSSRSASPPPKKKKSHAASHKSSHSQEHQSSSHDWQEKRNDPFDQWSPSKGYAALMHFGEHLCLEQCTNTQLTALNHMGNKLIKDVMADQVRRFQEEYQPSRASK